VRIFALFRRSGKAGGWRGPLQQRGQLETVGEQLIWAFFLAFWRTLPIAIALERKTIGKSHNQKSVTLS
jgi:hypothetical protein